MPKFKKFIAILFYLYLFLLPFQTRYIYNQASLNPSLPSPQNGGNNVWEYGTRSLYATEILLLIILLLFVSSSLYYLSTKNIPLSSLTKKMRQNLKSPHIFLPLLFLIWSSASILWAQDKGLAFYKWTILL
ncbi:MAG: hypothetical protein V1860_01265, partial [bacterium]